MKIKPEQVEAFTELSQDRNLLHVDPEYARTTTYGRPVVHGMCGVMLGLSHWAEGRAFCLKEIRGQFAKPLFVNEDYDVHVSESSEFTDIRLMKGPSVRCSFQFTCESGGVKTREEVESRNGDLFQPLLAPRDPDLRAQRCGWVGRELPYSISWPRFTESLAQLGFRSGQIPVDQINALLGSSYLIGMEIPGLQALFSDFAFHFESGTHRQDPTSFRFSDLEIDFDERFSRLTVTGRGKSIEKFSLAAFHRPRPVHYPIETIQSTVGRSDCFKDKFVLISGACRGFGAVLSKTFALQGANLLLNYRSCDQEAEKLRGEIACFASSLRFIRGDVSQAEDCRRMVASLGEQGVRVDYVIDNAYPAINPNGFLEQTTAEFLDFVQRALSTSVSFIHSMIPLVNDGGTIIQVSTPYTQNPIQNFGHYVTAKSAVEGLMRCLAHEFPRLNFLIVRPPRMMTDQTNLPFDRSPPVSAVEAALRLLDL